MENMIEQINEDGLFQGGWLCDGSGYRDRKNIIFIACRDNLCGLVQRNGKLIKIEYLKKVKDPQWSLPFWSDDQSPSITDTMESGLILIGQYLPKTDSA